MAIDTDTYIPEVNLPNIEEPDVQEGYTQATQSILDTDTTADIPYEEPEVGTAASGTSFVTPESTVQYQLTELLKQDSPYMRAAETKAREQSSQLGLLSSSMGIGASQAAAIGAALPIAQQDAETYGKAQQLEQQVQNQAFLTGEEGKVSAELQRQKYGLTNQYLQLQNTFDTIIKSADQQSAARLQESSRQWDFAIQDSLKRLDYQLQDSINRNQFEQQTAENVRSQAASLIENNQISIENMLKDPDMLELGAEAVSQNINNMINMTTASVQFLYDSVNLNVDGYITDLLTNLEETITW